MSSLEVGDRRRLLAAGVTTIAALPFLLGGHGQGTSTGVATIGEGANIVGALDASTVVPQAAANASDSVEAVGIPGFLLGPPPATDPSEVMIVVPTSRPANVVEGIATYARFVTDRFGITAPCAFPGPEVGTNLLVMDLDNGRSVWCTVVGPPDAAARADIVLGAAEFAQIADLGQSPVHVRITW